MGSGSPVVLIPGLSSPRAVWDDIAPQLAAKHKVYLVQVNGFGGDDPGANLQPGVLDGIVADLHAYLAEHKAAPARGDRPFDGRARRADAGQGTPGRHRRGDDRRCAALCRRIFVPGATVAQLEPQAKAMRDQMAASFGKPNPRTPRPRAEWRSTPPRRRRSRVDGQGRRARLGPGDVRGSDHRPAPRHGSIATPMTLVLPYSEAMPKERAEPFYRAEYASAPPHCGAGRRIRATSSCSTSPRRSLPRSRHSPTDQAAARGGDVDGQVHLGVEQFGDRAIGLGVLGQRAKPASSSPGTSAVSSRSERVTVKPRRPVRSSPAQWFRDVPSEAPAFASRRTGPW